MLATNRRKHTRILWTTQATIQTDPHNREVCQSVDVSKGGALLSVEQTWPTGTTIELTFRVGNFEIGPEEAHVIRNETAFWGRKRLLAIEFNRPQHALIEAIEYREEKLDWFGRKALRRINPVFSLA